MLENFGTSNRDKNVVHLRCECVGVWYTWKLCHLRTFFILIVWVWAWLWGSILFVLQNSLHFQTVEEYGRIYFLCTSKFLTFYWWRNILGSTLFVPQKSWHWQNWFILKVPNQCSDQIVRWPQNSFETLQEFWSEFWSGNAAVYFLIRIPIRSKFVISMSADSIYF